MKTLSEKLRNARAQLGISQSDLAQKVGVSTRMILAYEKTNSYPRPGTLIKLANALNVSVDYLQSNDVDTQGHIVSNPSDYDFNKEFDSLIQLHTAIFSNDAYPQSLKDWYFDSIMRAYLASKSRNL